MSRAVGADVPHTQPAKSTEPSKEEDSVPHLGVLEEDDEFEEFPVQDWDDSQTDLAHLGGVAPGAGKPDGDKLWEDNWDDDDIEEDFSVQLRSELQKTGKEAVPMQH
ncbi:DSS1/SEM1 family-domain-containing protein [Lactarius indigo]|nr:DSS1/SEM1 family-domain-containing protein [Lactarius indigo]